MFERNDFETRSRSNEGYRTSANTKMQLGQNLRSFSNFGEIKPFFSNISEIDLDVDVKR